MLDNQVLDPFNGVHDELATALDGPYERIFARQEARTNPLGIPAGEAKTDRRNSLLSGLAAVVITVALFAGGIAAVVAPAPALAVPAHTILL